MHPGLTTYRVVFGPDDRFRVRIVTSQRRVDDFTVQYETRVERQWKPVVRYDCAHSYPHQDILDADGHVITKIWWAGWPLAQALDRAIADVRANWRTYRDDFLRRHS